jgi:hypothetical protein
MSSNVQSPPSFSPRPFEGGRRPTRDPNYRNPRSSDPEMMGRMRSQQPGFPPGFGGGVSTGGFMPPGGGPGPTGGATGGFVPPSRSGGGGVQMQKQGAQGKAQGLINALRNRSGQPGGIQSAY